MLPIAVGLLCVCGARFDLWTWQFGIALLTVIVISSFCLLIVSTSRSLADIDRERNRVMEEREKLGVQRDNFMAVLTHDLKNPLIGMDRILFSLLRGDVGSLSSEQARIILLLKQSNDDLLVMVKNLLELYRFERDIQIFDFKESDIRPVIEQAVADIKQLADSYMVQLELSEPLDLPKVCIDNRAMMHVVTNLLQNAIKFSRQDGASVVRVSTEQLGSMVVVKIIDSGHGMSQDEQAKLFRRFEQGASGRHHKTGTGLGLFLCHQIVQSHTGTLTCASAAGVGTTFVISLPTVAPNLALNQASSAAR
jgi:signal transduction histidine kinase